MITSMLSSNQMVTLVLSSSQMKKKQMKKRMLSADFNHTVAVQPDDR
jgi:hypothetical protein